jgi:hypothetical protein
VIAKHVSTALQQTLLTDHRSTFETGRLMESRAKHDIYGLANTKLQTSDQKTSSKMQTRLKILSTGQQPFKSNSVSRDYEENVYSMIAKHDIYGLATNVAD